MTGDMLPATTGPRILPRTSGRVDARRPGACHWLVRLVVAVTAWSPASVSAQGASEELRWVVSEEPVLQIGTDPADDEYHQGRVVGFVLLEDGRMVLADGENSEIRIYAPSGQRLRTLGGRGEGPGEFMGLSGLSSGPGDSLMAFDEAVQRLTVLTREGDVVRTARVAGAPRALGTVIPTVSGSFIGIERGGTAPTEPDDIVRDTVRIGVLSPELEWAGEVARIPGPAAVTFSAMGRAATRSPVFAPRWVADGAGECAFVSPGDAPEVLRVHPRQPVQVDTLAFDIEARRPTSDDLDRWMEATLSEGPPEAAQMARMLFEGLPRMMTMPHFSGLSVDPYGLLWLEEYAPDGLSQRWFVVSHEGEMLGYVETPRAMRLVGVGEERMYGVVRGELGEAVLQVWRLDRPDMEGSFPSNCALD